MLKVDASLHDWNEIKDKFKGGGLLLGNGASLAVWKRFAYPSLFKVAKADIQNPLTDGDLQVFASMQTENFEQVLDALRVSRLVTLGLGCHSDTIDERYTGIRTALLEAVRAVHIPWTSIPPAVLDELANICLEYDTVFSTNYDWLLYWALMKSLSNPALPAFTDYFFGRSFDPWDIEVREPKVKFLFLHGALHIYRGDDGKTYKQASRDGKNLMELFDQGREFGKIPVFVSEGTSADKMNTIGRSDYLSFAYNKLATFDEPLVVFGHSLSNQDAHLLSAIALRRQRYAGLVKPPIGIAVFKGEEYSTIQLKTRLFRSLVGIEVFFFDSATHPLGAQSLSVG